MQSAPAAPDDRQRERLLKVLSAATFIIFFQAFMVAPIIPALSAAFETSIQAVGFIVPAYLIPYGSVIDAATRPVGGTLGDLFRGYRGLLATTRGQRTYAYVLLNSVFHSGVFTWLGVYLATRYGLGPIGIGLALLGYGIPGFVFG